MYLQKQKLIQLGLRCSQDFCEEIDPNEPHPKEFIPYSPVRKKIDLSSE